MATLEDPLRLVIGDKAAKRLDQALGIRTVGELLMHYPRGYEERGELTELTSLRDGEHVTVQAEIAKVTVRKMRSRPGTILEATVTDGRGSLTLTFFGRGRQDWRERELLPGVRGLFSGQVSTFQGKRQLAHPDYELLGAGDPAARATEFASELIPVYRATKEISSWKIANSVEIALDVLDVPSDPLPAGVRGRYGLCGYADALRGIHRPVDRRDLDRARLRLKWDEAFALQVVLAQRRLAAAEYSATHRPAAQGVRALPLAGGARAAPPGRGRIQRDAPAAGARRPAGRFRRRPAVRAHGGPAAGRHYHRRRSRPRAPDAPAAAGRGRLGQDGDRGPGDAAGGRRRRPGGAARPDRGTRAAALPVDQPAARAAGAGRPARRGRACDPADLADGLAGHGGTPGGAARGGFGRSRDSDRHARTPRRSRAVRRPWAGGH